MNSKLVFQFMAVSCSLNLEIDEVARVMELLLLLLYAAPGTENLKVKAKSSWHLILMVQNHEGAQSTSPVTHFSESDSL